PEACESASTSAQRPRSLPAATGFMPTARRPAARRASSSAQATSVLPTPVSVPVTKKPMLTSRLRQRGAQCIEELAHVLLLMRRRQRDAKARRAFRDRGRADRGHHDTALAEHFARPQGALIAAQENGLDRRRGATDLRRQPREPRLQGLGEAHELLPAPAFLANDREALLQRRGKERGARSRIDVAARALQHEFDERRSSGDEGAVHARGLAERADVDEPRRREAEVLEHAGAARAETAEAVRVVHHEPGIVALAELQQP